MTATKGAPTMKRGGIVWTAWPRDVGLGFSMSKGKLRCDLAPARDPDSRLTVWRADLWLGTDRAATFATVWGDDHHEAADNVAALLLEGDT